MHHNVNTALEYSEGHSKMRTNDDQSLFFIYYTTAHLEISHVSKYWSSNKIAKENNISSIFAIYFTFQSDLKLKDYDEWGN